MASVIAAAAVASALAGCGFLFRPAPPASVANAAEHAVEQLREIDGIASATARADADYRDLELDEEVAWWVDIRMTTVHSAPNLEALASEVERVLSEARRTVATTGYLALPAGEQRPKASFEFTGGYSPETVVQSAADLSLLRTVAGVTQVSVAHGRTSTSVTVASATRWGEVADELRRLPGFGGGALSSVALIAHNSSGDFDGQIDVDSRSPTPGLVAVFSDLAARDDVLRLEHSLGGVHADSSPQFRRPWLRVEVSSAAALERVALLLARVGDSQAHVSGQPRAAFYVSYYSKKKDFTREGYVGLPLGSSEPDDLPQLPDEAPSLEEIVADSNAPVVALDAAAAAARVEADRLAIEDLLTDAGDLAGVRGSVTVTSEECGAGIGQQVGGSVVIPIFEIADSAQDAFDAITAEWNENGFGRTDRAMGTDFYSADDSQAVGAHKLAIRGTAEGISISASSACILSQ